MNDLTLPQRNLRQRLFEPDASCDNPPQALHRYQHFTIFILLGIPTMLGFGISHLLQADYLLSLVILVSCSGLLAGWFQARRARNNQDIYRLNGLIYCALLIYMVVLGGDGGAKALWMYSIPLISIFLFGRLEGLCWSLGTLAVAGMATSPLSPFEPYSYGPDFKLRFFLSFLIVTTIAFWFEHQRDGYRKRLEQELHNLYEEQGRLQNALDEVARLRDLIPMCANCRKLRNDEGYWKDIESYLEDHARVQFTHGLCPECVEELYPFMKERESSR